MVNLNEIKKQEEVLKKSLAVVADAYLAFFPDRAVKILVVDEDGNEEVISATGSGDDDSRE